MSELLKPGQVVASDHNGPCCVKRFLGAGGQGEVYEATWTGTPHALKWYFPRMATAEQLSGLEKLIESPPTSDRFLWPLDLVRSPGVPGFGYIMKLRDARFRSLTDLVAG